MFVRSVLHLIVACGIVNAQNYFFSSIPGWANSTAVGIGNEVAWFGASQITTDQIGYATIPEFHTYQLSQRLDVFKFGFNASMIGTVTGIQVDMIRVADGRVTDFSIELLSNGKTLPSSDQCQLRTCVPWSTSIGSITIGGPTDLWGQDAIHASLIDSTFGVGLRIQSGGSTTLKNPRLYQIKMTVYFHVDFMVLRPTPMTLRPVSIPTQEPSSATDSSQEISSRTKASDTTMTLEVVSDSPENLLPAVIALSVVCGVLLCACIGVTIVSWNHRNWARDAERMVLPKMPHVVHQVVPLDDDREAVIVQLEDEDADAIFLDHPDAVCQKCEQRPQELIEVQPCQHRFCAQCSEYFLNCPLRDCSQQIDGRKRLY